LDFLGLGEKRGYLGYGAGIVLNWSEIFIFVNLILIRGLNIEP